MHYFAESTKTLQTDKLKDECGNVPDPARKLTEENFLINTKFIN
jgi:hypothetical protein